MWQKIKKVIEDVKSYLGLLVGLFGVLNNHLHIFMPLAPDTRLRADVFVILIPAIGILITVVKVHDKAGPGLRGWVSITASIWTTLGFLAWAAYAPIVSYLQSHSSSASISLWFDAIQIGAYVLPFLCWSIAVSALLSLFI